MRCEAMVLIETPSHVDPEQGRYVCCGKEDAHLHHKITRARGGLILDKAGETYHQMYLCAEHHALAHDKPAFDNGLLLRGFVTTGMRGEPIYRGPDPYLKERYGDQVHT